MRTGRNRLTISRTASGYPQAADSPNPARPASVVTRTSRFVAIVGSAGASTLDVLDPRRRAARSMRPGRRASIRHGCGSAASSRATPRLRQVMDLLVLIAGDEYGIEPSAIALHRLQRRQVRPGKVFLVRHEHAVVRRSAPLREVPLAVHGGCDPKRDETHLKPLGEIRADELTEALRQAVDARRVQRHPLFGRERRPAAEVDRHRARVDPLVDAHPLCGPQEQVEAQRVDLVVRLDRRVVLLGRQTALRVPHQVMKASTPSNAAVSRSGSRIDPSSHSTSWPGRAGSRTRSSCVRARYGVIIVPTRPAPPTSSTFKVASTRPGQGPCNRCQPRRTDGLPILAGHWVESLSCGERAAPGGRCPLTTHPAHTRSLVRRSCEDRPRRDAPADG